MKTIAKENWQRAFIWYVEARTAEHGAHVNQMRQPLVQAWDEERQKFMCPINHTWQQLRQRNEG